MSKKNNRRKRNKLKRPPLSFLDKCVYFLLLLMFLTIMGFYLLFAAGVLGKERFFVSQEIVAVTFTGLGWRFPFLFYLLLTFLPLFCGSYEERIPFFGNRDQKYRSVQWKVVTPIFSKEWREKRKCERPSRIRFRRQLWTIWVVGLLITVLLIPLGLFGRIELDNRNILHRYNFLNQETHSYSAHEVEEMSVSLYGIKSVTPSRMSAIRYLRNRYKLCVYLYLPDGDKVKLDYAGFYGEDRESIFRQILELKEQIDPDKIRYNNSHRLDDYIEKRDLSYVEQELIRAIFDVKEGSG